jgi:hypothetical protein
MSDEIVLSNSNIVIHPFHKINGELIGWRIIGLNSGHITCGQLQTAIHLCYDQPYEMGEVLYLGENDE